MTTKEVKQELQKRDKEINKLKSFCTRLVNALTEKKDLPSTNWSKMDNQEQD